MAKRKRPTKASQQNDLMDDMKTFIRTEGLRYLNARNINSIGIGRKISAKGPSGAVCIQFTVDRKATAEHLEGMGSRFIPAQFVIGDRIVPSDVIERRFRPGWRPVTEVTLEKAERKSRQKIVAPGISIGHRRGTAGTIGALVYDRANGAPLLLSNWHVLQMKEDDTPGAIGDEIVQPGPYDDNRVSDNVVGKLVRSHLGFAGDCAVASIEGRGFRPEVYGLQTVPLRVGRAELDDVVMKSGRTTEVTRGIVTRIEVQTKMNYGEREEIIGGFEIGPHPDDDADREISMGGDSGAAWMAVDPDTGKAIDVMLGLHFAGEASAEQPEFALACAAHSVLEKLDVTLAPPSGRGDGAVVERVIGGDGYDVNFIGVDLDLPLPATQKMKDDLIGADGAAIANYTHFSLAIRKSKRMAAFVGWNMDGNITKPDSKEASWQIDPRIPKEYQLDNTIYRHTKFDRGHVAKREDLLWGGKARAKRANDDSFCYTNATPQHENFNRLAPALWKSLEDEIFRQVPVADLRIALIGGPIFSATDRQFVPSAAPAGFQPVSIPKEFFKIVAYRDNASGVKVLAFRLSQAELVAGKLESVTAESLDLAPFEMYQVSVANIEAATGLRFPAFKPFDTKPAAERVGLEAEGSSRQIRPIRSFGDIVR